jgi:hypothetical protein
MHRLLPTRQSGARHPDWDKRLILQNIPLRRSKVANGMPLAFVSM